MFLNYEKACFKGIAHSLYDSSGKAKDRNLLPCLYSLCSRVYVPFSRLFTNSSAWRASRPFTFVLCEIGCSQHWKPDHNDLKIEAWHAEANSMSKLFFSVTYRQKKTRKHKDKFRLPRNHSIAQTIHTVIDGRHRTSSSQCLFFQFLFFLFFSFFLHTFTPSHLHCRLA